MTEQARDARGRFTSNLDKLVSIEDNAAPPRSYEPPGIVWDGSKGEIRTSVQTSGEPRADWNDLLVEWGLDPNEIEVVEPVQRRSWDASIGNGEVKRFHYFKAALRRRSGRDSDISSLIAEIRDFSASQVHKAASSSAAFVLCSGDLQAGKRDGDGTAGMVNRFLSGINSGVGRLADLRDSGVLATDCAVYLPWLGDCIEHVKGHYAMQTYMAELSLTEQIRVVRRLMVAQIKAFAPLTPRLVVPVVPGNHDEAIRDSSGKAMTNFGDSFSTEIAVSVSEILKENPAFDHVEVMVPQGEELTLTVDISGTIVGLAHGHQFGADPMKWWANQAHGHQPIGSSTLLLAGHLHHLRIHRPGLKTFIQIPALDGGSTWYRHRTGQDSLPGILSLVVGDGSWSHLLEL